MFGTLLKIEKTLQLVDFCDLLQPASSKGLNHCVKCGFCCIRKTCVPSPNELIKIADFLQITVKELLHSYYTIDITTKATEMEGIFYPRPINQSQLDLVGKFLFAERSFDVDKCIFQGKNNKCKIYPIRPNQAKITICWGVNDDAKKEAAKSEEDLYLKWKQSSLLIDNDIDTSQMDD